MWALIAITFRLALPLIAFLFIGVPLESYVRGLSGFLSDNKDAMRVMADHMFIEAAACFYCITVLLECILIITRPHIQANPKVNSGHFTLSCSVVCMIAICSYASIKYEISEKSLNSFHAELLLSCLIILTIFLTVAIHIVDYICSDVASADTSSAGRKR